MQYDIDINGKYSDIFIKLRNIILNYEGIYEIKNVKQTTYHDTYGRAVCMLRGRREHFILAFAQGYKLQEKYPFLKGYGKIVRHLYYKDLHEIDELILREIFTESLLLNLEAVELKKFKRVL